MLWTSSAMGEHIYRLYDKNNLLIGAVGKWRSSIKISRPYVVYRIEEKNGERTIGQKVAFFWPSEWLVYKATEFPLEGYHFLGGLNEAKKYARAISEKFFASTPKVTP